MQSVALSSLGDKLSEAIAQFLRPEDLDALSNLLMIFDGMRARQEVWVALNGRCRRIYGMRYLHCICRLVSSVELCAIVVLRW